MATKSTSLKLTTKQLIAGFAVSDMSIYTWRQGTATRDKLPTEHLPTGRKVQFDAKAVQDWAKKHGLPFDLTKARSAGSEAAVKPGPKGKVVAAAPTKGKTSVPAKKATKAKKAA